MLKKLSNPKKTKRMTSFTERTAKGCLLHCGIGCGGDIEARVQNEAVMRIKN
jgi:hypothetical protein